MANGNAARPVGGHEDPLPCELAFTWQSLPQVRRMTVRWAAAAGFPEDQAADFALAVHEIACNALVHGAPPARLQLRSSEAAPSAVTAVVRDRGRWLSAAPRAGSSRPGGWGLPLARRVCDTVDIERRPKGTTVTLRVTRRAG